MVKMFPRKPSLDYTADLPKSFDVRIPGGLLNYLLTLVNYVWHCLSGMLPQTAVRCLYLNNSRHLPIYDVMRQRMNRPPGLPEEGSGLCVTMSLWTNKGAINAWLGRRSKNKHSERYFTVGSYRGIFS